MKLNGKAPLIIKKLRNPSEKELDSYLSQGWKILSQKFWSDQHRVVLIK